MADASVKLFALNASHEFGAGVARHLGVDLSPHEEREFEDGEHKCRPLISVRGAHAFVVQSLYADSRQSVNDKLCRLLFFVGALKDASAARVTVLVPYLCYARKERKTQLRDPVLTRYVAALFEAVGTDHIVALDVHNVAAFQNAYRCRTDHLEARPLFVRHFAPLLRNEDAVIVSPDVGGVKRAEQLRVDLETALGRKVESAFMEKTRSQGVVRGRRLIGDVGGSAAVIVDDIIGTGTTIARAVDACHASGAKRIYAAATHGIFVGGASQVVADPRVERVVVSDSIPPFRLPPELIDAKIAIVDSAALFAEIIGNMQSLH